MNEDLKTNLLRVVVTMSLGGVFAYFGAQMCLVVDIFLGAGHLQHEFACKVGGGIVGGVAGLWLGVTIVRPRPPS